MGQKGGGFPSFCDSCPNHGRLGILTSGDDPFFSGRQGDPNSIILLVCHLLIVELLLVCENQVGQHAFINVLKNFPAFLDPYCHMMMYQLITMHHLKRVFIQDCLSTLGAWWICPYQLLQPMSCNFNKGCIAAFPSCF